MLWRRNIVSPQVRDWVLENYDWVERNHSQQWAIARLITPTRAFFPVETGTDIATATKIAQQIADHLGIAQPFHLEELPELPEELRHQYGLTAEVAGQYWHDGDAPLITYRPSLMRQPMAFINTMTHELMHLRLAKVMQDLPGGADTHELATDLHCIIAGFGIFQLQASEDLGWSGYLSQPTRAFALAQFLKRKNLPIEEAENFLSRRPARWLRKAQQMV